MKNSTTWLGLGLTLIFGGLGVWSVPQALTKGHERQVVILGGSVILIGGVILLWLLALPLTSRVRSGINYLSSGRLERSLRKQFFEIEVKESSLDGICSTGRSLVGDRHPPVDLLTERFLYTKGVIRAIAPVAKPDAIAGYYIIYALNKRACDDLNEGVIESAKGMKTKAHFTKKFANCTGIYVSMVMANDEIRARACLLHHMKTTINEYKTSYGAIKYVYARPYTSDGRRLVKRHRFREINSQAGLWRLDLG